LSIFTYPLHVLTNILRFIFNILHIPFPRFTALNFYRPPRSSGAGGGGSAGGSIEKWVRQLEEETGATCVGRVSGASVSSGTEPGPSSAGLMTRSRGEQANEEGRKQLPDFCTGTYEAFLTRCQKEAKIGCVALVSEEHDDVAEFKRWAYPFSLCQMTL
jgi:FAS-associated factor 2